MNTRTNQKLLETKATHSYNRRIVIVGKCSLDYVDDQAGAVLPVNALLLMRCRSVPAKSWLEEANKVEEDEEDQGDKQECKRKNEEKRKKLRSLMEKENRKVKESLVVMKYDLDFYEISFDIA
ncbi:hypothetical protein GOBAR_DD17939 [Gossypium barbadense]|nr:hypothetical protein GOBAR_DD17939 [Gossypium barbadense]